MESFPNIGITSQTMLDGKPGSHLPLDVAESLSTVDHRWSSKKRNDVSSMVATQLGLSHLSYRYTSFTEVYIDGSTNVKGSASAFVIPSLDLEQSFRLSHRSSSSAAELHAILWAIQFTRRTVTMREWVICSDSKMALTPITLINCKKNNDKYA